MRIKTLVMGVAIALAFSAHSAAAAEQFSVLDGIRADPMNASQMAAVVGSHAQVIFSSGNSPNTRGGGPNSPHIIIISSGPGLPVSEKCKGCKHIPSPVFHPNP